MLKYILMLTLTIFAACNNSQRTEKTSEQSNQAKDTGWTADEMEFIDGCVENSRESLGEERAFLLCKCILLQVKNENPSMDSTYLVRLSNDTAKVAQLAKNCK